MTVDSFTIVGIGEILWDLFPDGPRFGGAPANFTSHAAALNGGATMISAVGRDPLGKLALECLQQRNVKTDAVQISPAHPTGSVKVTLGPTGQAHYEFGEDEAWDHLSWSDALHQIARTTDAVCYGTLGQRSDPSAQTIQQFVASTPENTFRICDVNLRSTFYCDAIIDQSLSLANVLKLNDEELPVLARLYGLSGGVLNQLRGLIERFSLRLVAYTRGPHGAMLVQPDGLYDHAGLVTSVVDTVGAGDCYAAGLTLGLLRRLDLEAVNSHACQLAAYVCSQSGATPSLPGELLQVPDATPPKRPTDSRASRP